MLDYKIAVKNILIFGCGAIGGVIAEKLSHVSNVTAYDINPKLVKTIRENGVKILELNGLSKRTKINITNHLADLKKTRFDLIILATKSYDTKAAVKVISRNLYFKKIMSIQNGLNNLGTIAELIPRKAIICAVTTMAAELLSKGRIRLFSPGKIYLSPFHAKTPRILNEKKLLMAAGFNVKISNSYESIIWPKLIFNSVMNPFTIISQSDYRIIKNSKEAQKLIKSAIKEGTAVAKKTGIKLYFNPSKIINKLRATNKIKKFYHKGSMYYDLMNGKKTELEFITGEIIKKADRLKIKTPVLETIYLTAKIIEKNRFLNQNDR